MDRAARAEIANDRDQVVVLGGVAWSLYEDLLRTRGKARQPRFAYLDGELEIVTTSFRHEINKTLVARLVEAFAEERDLSLNGLGSSTFRKKAKRAGLEPDECYCLGRIKDVPDVAIEVVITSGGIDKLEIYRRLGVPEVWFWIDGRIVVHVLVGPEYRRRSASTFLRGLDLEELAWIVTATRDERQTQAVRAFRKSLHRR